MAVTATRTTTITYAGNVQGTQTLAAASNAASPGKVDLVSLASGANTISAPTGGSTPVSVTIVPPAGNTVLMTVKGVTGDIGVPIHKTDPTTLALDSTFSSFCLTAAGIITGVRFFWT